MTGRLCRILLFPIFILAALQSDAQTNQMVRRAKNQLNESQKSFNKLIARTNVDKNAKAILVRFGLVETDSLQKVMDNAKNLTLEHKMLAMSAQTRFFDTLLSEINGRQFDVDYTRLYIDRFKQVWQYLITRKPYEEIMRNFEPKTSAMMAGVFRDYPGAETIRDLAILKGLESSPEKITSFLSNNTTFSLLDSLIFMSGNSQPELFMNFATSTRDEVLIEAIKNHPSPIIRTLMSLSGEKEKQDYLPFVVQLSENQLTLADINKTRTQPKLYYQLLVDAEIANVNKMRQNEIPVYVEPTRKYVRRYAIKFYSDVINSLHEESSEARRYFVLEELRPQDLYYIITNGESELYTSSYLYMYKKLMGMFSKTGADSLFRLVKYDQYKKFLMMAGRFNTLSSFMKQMPPDSSIAIIKKMMYGLETDVLNGLEETINVAESFPGMINDETLAALTTREIKSNYNRTANIPNPYGMKVYSLLGDVFYAIKQGDSKNAANLNPALTVYFKIAHSALTGGKGSIDQQVIFYGDEDGRSSYSSFMTNFTDGSKWSIDKNKQWTVIKSKSKFPVTIYANLPMTEDGGEDVKAQRALNSYLAGANVQPEVMIHRGHSYHLPNSLNYVSPAVKLAILGSCGGYTEIFQLLKKSPEAQVISTKQVGSRLVNEPLLRQINELLLNKSDLDWAEVWKQLEKQVKDNKQAYDYFREYVPPYKNVALLVSALFAQSGIEYLAAR